MMSGLVDWSAWCALGKSDDASPCKVCVCDMSSGASAVMVDIKGLLITDGRNRISKVSTDGVQ